jgi:subtilisin family serine protease
MQGTSMAAPHVAGLAALLLESDPQLTAEEIRQAIMAGARPTGGDPNIWGAGRADASATLPE